MRYSQMGHSKRCVVDFVFKRAFCAQVFRRVMPLLIVGVIAAGCTAPLENTEIEEGIITLDQHQKALQTRIEKLEKRGSETGSLLRSNAEMTAKLEALTTEVRSLNGKMDEQKNQVNKLSRRVDDQAFALKSLKGSPTAPGGGVSPPPPPAPSVDPNVGSTPPHGSTRAPANDHVVLPGKSLEQGPPATPTEVYNLAYSDYVKGNDDLAISGFTRFVQQFPASILAPNAIYWTGEIYYSRRAYPKAIIYFEQVHQKYPKSEKAAAGLLKSGYAQLELGNRPRAEVYLKKVIEQFPQSNEASLAKDKLAGLN